MLKLQANYWRKVLPSELTNTIEQFSVYVHRNEAQFTYMYADHTNVFEAANIYKTLPQMSFHLYFLLFLFRSAAPPMTLLTAGALTDPQLPATVTPPHKYPVYAGISWPFLFLLWCLLSSSVLMALPICSVCYVIYI